MEEPKRVLKLPRREKFSLPAKGISPLAPKLEHPAIQQMSVDPIQNDSHFIKKIIEYAEESICDGDAWPSLEFGLIGENVIRVGSSATLVVLKNELNLTSSADVVAPCNVSCSTTKGKRDAGLIGSKGVGLKSVFMISETSPASSNGYWIDFQAELFRNAGMRQRISIAHAALVLLLAFGRSKLPTTMMVLPIRKGKADLVLEQLMKLSPETVLFLKRIRELKVWVNLTGSMKPIVSITRSEPISAITSTTCKFFAVTLRVINEMNSEDKYSYLMFQKAYPVTQPVEERQGVPEWTITLAYPKNLERIPAGRTGDIFSLLPTEIRTGFPFLIDADFIVSSSTPETIRCDSNWNVGILNCIPDAYRIAFQIMARIEKAMDLNRITLHPHFYLLNPDDVWKYLPTNTVNSANRYCTIGSSEDRQVRQRVLATNVVDLEKVRAEILRYFAPLNNWRQMNLSFRRILALPARQHVNARFRVVKMEVQEKYGSILSAIGARQMTADQYKSFVVDNSKWLLELPEMDYHGILSFFAFEINLSESVSKSSFLQHLRLLKVRGRMGSIELASVHQLGEGTTLLYTYPEQYGAEDAAWISEWVAEFSPWLPAKVMPAETTQALLMASNRDALTLWIQETYGSLTQLIVQDYCEKLITKLLVCAEQTNSCSVKFPDIKRPFLFLVLQFLYSVIRKGLVIESELPDCFGSLGNVTVLECLTQESVASLKSRSEGEESLTTNLGL